VGAAWLMTELTTSHMLVAAVQASNVLPMLFLSIFAGAIADNFDRRRVMLLSQWFMLIVSTVLAVLAWGGKVGAAGLLAFTLAVGLGSTLNLPSWSASVRAMVERRALPQAISLNSIAVNLARTVGPALAGVVLATAGVAVAFALNAFSYIAVIVALIRWRPAMPPPLRQPLMPSIRAGIDYCRHSDPVRRILLRGVGISVGGIAFQALLPVMVRTTLHGGEAEFGILLGIFGIGAVVGALVSAGLRRRIGSDSALFVAATCLAAALAVLARAGSMLLLVPAPLVAGIGWTIALNTLNVAMQVRSPEAILGRCMAIYQAITFGSAAIGAWGWGLLADLTDPRTALLGAAAWIGLGTIVLRVIAPLPARGEGVVLLRQ